MSLSDEAWTAELDRLPLACRDVYFTPAYHHLHATGGEGAPACVRIEDGDRRLLIPGLRVPIGNTGRDDFQTGNGYGGPLGSDAANTGFVEEAWARWRERAAVDRIVAAFFRLHPLLGNERWLPADAELRVDRRTVGLDLAAGTEELWNHSRPRHRRKVRSARRDGQVVKWDRDEDWDAFPALYAEALERLQAPERLRFPVPYFDALRRLAGAQLAAVRDDAGLAAAAVFLAGPLWYHYHLSARRPGTGNDLTSLLLQEGLERAGREGRQAMHVGGGRTAAADDTLLAFKESLGGRLLDFKVAMVVVDRDAYAGLVEAWQAETGRPPEWMLGYRQPKTGAMAVR
jgi:UDP-N-acetylbacillosamine alanyltransferase